MALSDEEQRLLEQMEAALAAEDPKLVNALRNAPKARGRWGEQQLKNVIWASISGNANIACAIMVPARPPATCAAT